MKLKIYPLAVLLLAACTSPKIQQSTKNEVDEALARARIGNASISSGVTDNTRGSAPYADKLAAQQLDMPVLRHSKKSWLGSQMVPVTNDDKLPSIFKQQFTLEFDDKKVGRLISLTTIATRLSAATGVAVRVQPDAMESWAKPGDTQKSAGAVPLPPMNNGMVPAISSLMPPQQQSQQIPTESASPSSVTVNSLEMKWHGTLVGFLNNLTDRLGLAWEFRDNTVVIMKYVTEYHEIATFSGETDYSMGTGGSTSGSSSGGGSSQSSSSQLSVSENGKKSDPLGSIEKAVKEMVSSVPGSTVTRSDGSGRLVVKTSREMQAQVRDFLKAENSSMLRQVQIQFDIYSVRTEEGDERGVNWSAVLNTLSNMYGVTVGSPTSLTSALSGTIGLNILKASGSTTSKRFGDSSVMLNLLNQYGTSAQHRPVSLIARNRTWARKSRLSTEGYLAETTPGPASSTGVGAPGLKTDKITTGDQYVALPQILDNNTVMLKFGVSLSDLLGLFDVTVGTGLTQQKVQTPRTSSTGDQYDITLAPGEVMTISGLSRLVTTSDQRALAENASIGFGGSRKINMMREHFVIFVRTVIL